MITVDPVGASIVLIFLIGLVSFALCFANHDKRKHFKKRPIHHHPHHRSR